MKSKSDKDSWWKRRLEKNIKEWRKDLGKRGPQIQHVTK